MELVLTNTLFINLTNNVLSGGVIITSLYLILLGFLGHFVIKPILIKYNISALKSLFFINLPIMLIGLAIAILIDKKILFLNTFIGTEMIAGVISILTSSTRYNHQKLF